MIESEGVVKLFYNVKYSLWNYMPAKHSEHSEFHCHFAVAKRHYIWNLSIFSSN